MYINCRASSLLDWKIITDQNAENYLFQLFIRKTEWKNLGDNDHEANQSQTGIGKTSHSAKTTRYKEKRGTDSPMGVGQTKHNQAKMKEQEAKEKFKKRGEALRKKITRKIILDVMETGHLTMEEGEVELKELETRQRVNKETPKEQTPRE